jgi:hypothetical protein
MRALPLAVMAVMVSAAAASAQAVPEDAQASRVRSELRRAPQLRADPFRYVMVPRWGFVFEASAFAGRPGERSRECNRAGPGRF